MALKIVFMGTPYFAVESLKALVENRFDVKMVFSQPDRPRGRGHKLAYTPVKEYALTHNIDVFQPNTLKDSESIELIKQFEPDVIVVVAYGKLLPKAVLDIPKYGCVNVHGSLLPKYRGAAPIQWSVLNGDGVSGVTTMYMAQGLDTGDMILSEKVDILPNETASELYDRLAVVGADTLIRTLNLIETGRAPRIPQDDALASYAPMLSKEMSEIDFNKSAQLVKNQILGLSDWPCATTVCTGKRLKVYRASLADGYSGTPGELLDNKRFIVGCADGAVELTEVQSEGSKRTDGESFLRGRRLTTGKKIWEE